MKNYWLDRKKCEKRWKRIEMHSGNCCLIMKDDGGKDCGEWKNLMDDAMIIYKLGRKNEND